MGKHPFSTLQSSPFRVDYHEAEPYLQWLLVGGATYDNLWNHTNLKALEIELRKHHIDSAIISKTDENCYDILLIDPDYDDLVADAASLHRLMQTRHIDEAIYNKAIDEVIDEAWGDLDIPDRIELHGDFPINAGELWGNTCPDDLRAAVQEQYLPAYCYDD